MTSASWRARREAARATTLLDDLITGRSTWFFWSGRQLLELVKVRARSETDAPAARVTGRAQAMLLRLFAPICPT
jgi:hypothetical protein